MHVAFEWKFKSTHLIAHGHSEQEKSFGLLVRFIGYGINKE